MASWHAWCKVCGGYLGHTCCHACADAGHILDGHFSCVAQFMEGKVDRGYCELDMDDPGFHWCYCNEPPCWMREW